VDAKDSKSTGFSSRTQVGRKHTEKKKKVSKGYGSCHGQPRGGVEDSKGFRLLLRQEAVSGDKKSNFTTEKDEVYNDQRALGWNRKVGLQAATSGELINRASSKKL